MISIGLLESAPTTKLRTAALERSVNICERCFLNPIVDIFQIGQRDESRLTSEDFLGLCASCQAWLTGKGETDPLTRIAGTWGRMFRHYGLIKETEPQVSSDLEKRMLLWQRLLPGSLAEEFLGKRRIPLEVAQELKIGYAPDWTSPEAPEGRLVFPACNTEGGITNVLGRVLGEGVSPEKRWVWRGELPGYVNGGLLGRITTKRLMVVRNPLDYVALVLAGREQGVDLPIIALGICTWRWLWGTIPSEIVFAFETSKSDGFANFPRECKIVNKSGYILPPKEPYEDYLEPFVEQDNEYLQEIIERFLTITKIGGEK